MMLTQYSVSPRRMLNNFGPKPSEKVNTRTPCQRATRKCPSSCTKTSTPRTKRNGRSVDIRTSGDHGAGTNHLSSIRAGPAVQFPDFRHVRGAATARAIAPGMRLQRRLDGGCDARKRELPLKE